jgi:hypothetical protein
MVDVNQYTVSNRELVELIIKSAGVTEGRWILMANFGFAPGNYGPSPETLSPGVAVVVQSLGIQRLVGDSNMPPEVTVDAAVVNPKLSDANTPRAKGKVSSTRPR